MQRTDEDIISKAPIELTLGAKKYPVKLLTIGPAREWRKLLVTTMGEVNNAMGGDMTPESFGRAFAVSMIKFPEKLIELVMAYGPDLPRDTIESEATDEQIAVAYGRIVAVAFPFLASLATTRKVLTSQ